MGCWTQIDHRHMSGKTDEWMARTEISDTIQNLGSGMKLDDNGWKWWMIDGQLANIQSCLKLSFSCTIKGLTSGYWEVLNISFYSSLFIKSQIKNN